jgi:adhesin transport system outer membrane protein
MYRPNILPRTKSWVIGLTLLGGLLPSAAVVAATTLAEAVAQTLVSNPDLAEVKSQWEARREEVNRALAGYRPTLDLNAGIGSEHTNSPSTRARGLDSVELTRKEFGLNATQMLFDGWGTSNEVSRQRSRLQSAAARVREVAESLAMRTSESFVDVLRFRELDALAAKNLQVLLRIQDQIRLRSEAGVGRRADYDQVNSRVALAKANKVAAEVNVTDAETTYRRVVGSAPTGDLPTPILAAGQLPPGLESVIEAAKSANPVLARAEADIKAAQAQNAAARQFNYPRLDLEVGGNANDNIDGAKGYNNDLTTMVRMRFNLYRGGADSARIRETAYNVNQAKDVRDRALRQLEESTRLAWSAYQATAAQLPLLRQRVTAAQATLVAYEKQFNIGQRTLLDVLNSENEALQARQEVVDAEADHLLAKYRILEAMGALLEHFAIAPPLVGGV